MSASTVVQSNNSPPYNIENVVVNEGETLIGVFSPNSSKAGGSSLSFGKQVQRKISCRMVSSASTDVMYTVTQAGWEWTISFPFYRTVNTEKSWKFPILFIEGEVKIMRRFSETMELLFGSDKTIKYEEKARDFQQSRFPRLTRLVFIIENRISAIRVFRSRYLAEIQAGKEADEEVIRRLIPEYMEHLPTSGGGSTSAGEKHWEQIVSEWTHHFGHLMHWSCNRRIRLIEIHTQESLRIQKMASDIGLVYGSAPIEQEERRFLNQLQAIENIPFSF